MGAVVEAASHQKLGEYPKAHIFVPLGMEHTGFSMTPWQSAHFLEPMAFHPETMMATPVAVSNWFMLSQNYESGGAGLISTVDDYIRFLDALCNRGVGAQGYHLLRPETIDLMRTDQLGAASQKDFALLRKPGY